MNALKVGSKNRSIENHKLQNPQNPKMWSQIIALRHFPATAAVAQRKYFAKHYIFIILPPSFRSVSSALNVLFTSIETSKRQLMIKRLKAAATVDSCIKHWTLAEIMRSVSESDSQTVSSVIGRQHIPNMGQLMLLQRGGARHILAFWEGKKK